MRSALEWFVLPLPAQHEWSGPRRPAPRVLCREWQHKPLQRRPYEWSISILPRKRWAAMLKRPGWQRHCDDESVHRYSVRTIDQCDVTIASGSHIDVVTIAKLLTFEIISGAARNEWYDFRLCKTTWRFNYKWAVVFAMVNITRGWIHVRDDRFSKFRNNGA